MPVNHIVFAPFCAKWQSLSPSLPLRCRLPHGQQHSASRKNNSKQTNCSYFLLLSSLLLLSSFFVNFTFLVISIYFICNFDLNFFSLSPVDSFVSHREESATRRAYFICCCFIYLQLCLYLREYLCVCVCACACDCVSNAMTSNFVYCASSWELFLHLPAGLFIGFWLRVERALPLPVRFSWSARRVEHVCVGGNAGFCGPKGWARSD